MKSILRTIVVGISLFLTLINCEVASNKPHDEEIEFLSEISLSNGYFIVFDTLDFTFKNNLQSELSIDIQFFDGFNENEPEITHWIYSENDDYVDTSLDTINIKWEIPFILCKSNCVIRIEALNSNSELIFKEVYPVIINLNSESKIAEMNKYLPNASDDFWLYDVISFYHYGGKNDSNFVKVFYQSEEKNVYKFDYVTQNNSEPNSWGQTLIGRGFRFSDFSSALFPASNHEEHSSEIEIPLGIWTSFNRLISTKGASRRLIYHGEIEFEFLGHKTRKRRFESHYDFYGSEIHFLRDIGIYYQEYHNDGITTKYTLTGAYINGVVYGDTTFVNK